MSGATAAMMTGGGPVLSVLPGSYSETNVGAPESVSLRYNSNGSADNIRTLAGTFTAGTWCSPSVYAPGAYTIRCHVTAGTFSSGDTQDVDLALTAARTWTVTQGSAGTKTCTATITIKDGIGNTVATGAITLSATF